MIIGPDLIEKVARQVELIIKCMKEAQDRQKSYTDLKRSPSEFEIRESVFLMLSPIRGVVIFDKFGKISSRYMGLFEVLKRVG